MEASFRNAIKFSCVKLSRSILLISRELKKFMRKSLRVNSRETFQLFLIILVVKRKRLKLNFKVKGKHLNCVTLAWSCIQVSQSLVMEMTVSLNYVMSWNRSLLVTSHAHFSSKLRDVNWLQMEVLFYCCVFVILQLPAWQTLRELSSSPWRRFLGNISFRLVSAKASSIGWVKPATRLHSSGSL